MPEPETSPASMRDERAARLLNALPEGEFILEIKFIREHAEGDWVVTDKFDPVRAKRKTGQDVIEIWMDI